jgi:glycosyltransferase involved in cell wall biosynthesis
MSAAADTQSATIQTAARPQHHVPFQSIAAASTGVTESSTRSPETALAHKHWQPRSVSIVHDYCNQRGGAERVVLALASMFPRAPVYASLYRPRSTFAEFSALDMRLSPLQRLPVDHSFRTLLPLYPLAFRALGRLDSELVLCSSSGWAHGVRAAPGALHVVYCHTPARWLYATNTYLRSAGRTVLAPVLAPLRRWDSCAARRADAYIANSQNVRRRILATYGIEADVVNPPVDVHRFTPRSRGERLLVVSRLLPYKRVDLAVAAANRLGMGLDVVGHGPELGRLRALAGPNVKFHGRADDDTVTELLESCRTLCVPGAEDFGITMVEAMAAGKPVVAFGEGGALEILTDPEHGVLFEAPTEDAVVNAIVRAETLESSPRELARHAARFSTEAFHYRLALAVHRAHERRLATASVPDLEAVA